MSPRISVIIPTQRRPKGLALAARSICRQSGLDPAALELVIVDNDQCPSARALTAELGRLTLGLGREYARGEGRDP